MLRKWQKSVFLWAIFLWTYISSPQISCTLGWFNSLLWTCSFFLTAKSLPWSWQTHFLRMFWSQFFCVACKSQHLMWNRFWAWNSISNQPGFGESISRGVPCVIFVDSFGCQIHKDDHNMSSSQGVMEIVCTLQTLLEIGYMSSIFIAFCSASTPNLLETVWSKAEKSMFLSSTCTCHANDYEELHFSYWVTGSVSTRSFSF